MFILFLIMVYFIPTTIGIFRMQLNIWAIMLTNIFLGWTVVGWLVAFVLSVKNNRPDRINHVINALGRRDD